MKHLSISEYTAWKDHPVTGYFFKELIRMSEEVEVPFSISDGCEKIALTTAYMNGYKMAIRCILNDALLNPLTDK